MITGIIFVCALEKVVCAPVVREFDTVEECITVTTEVIKNTEARPEAKLYYICDSESQPA